MVLRYAQSGFESVIRAASSLPCPVGWLRSPLESALGWIALPLVQAVTGVSPDTAATVDRLNGTVRGLESILGRLQTETTSRRARRARQWRLRLAALEAAANADRTRAAALDAQVIALRDELAALPVLAAELATLRAERTQWTAIAADRDRRQRDATAHVEAVDAGWRARLAGLDRDAAARIAAAGTRADLASRRTTDLEAALTLAHHHVKTLHAESAANIATVTAECEALQAGIQVAAAREQDLATQALQLEAALAEVVSHTDARERAAAQRWQAWGEEIEARVARERTRLTAALDERQNQITALARALDDARATYEAETHRRATDRDHLAAAATELEVRLATAETQVEMERRSHDSALTDAYQTLTQREHDLEQMRQRAQRLEAARATAVQELRALRAELESLRPGTTAPADDSPAANSGAGVMAGAISRLLKGGGGRDEPDPS